MVVGSYFHSVRLDVEKCRGCTNCIRRCPTEAIRVRDGKARISEDRCIDCGECIRVCPNQAKIAVSDHPDRLKEFKYTIALPAPSLYGQFPGKISIGSIHAALLRLGFDRIFEVAFAADLVSTATQQYITSTPLPRPLISQACPAKITAARRPRPHPPAGVDGVLTIRQVYGEIHRMLPTVVRDLPVRATAAGISWGRSGGEAMALGSANTLVVDGIHNVISVLAEVEMGHLTEIDFLECQACTGGCVGGALTVTNPHLAKARLKQQAGTARTADQGQREHFRRLLDGYRWFQSSQVASQPRQPFSLDKDVAAAINKLEKLEKTLASLPGLDCGSCGAPTCRALAEDIVQGLSLETDCVFKLREKVSKLAKEVMELASLVPPAMGSTRETKPSGEDESGHETG